MFKQETIDAMWDHFTHAKEKHPFFADRVMEPMPPKLWRGELVEEIFKRRCADYWDNEAECCKAAIREIPSVENVLNAEVFEIFAAVAKGDLKQAHYEIFDAIAVLLRLDEEMEKILGVEVEK